VTIIITKCTKIVILWCSFILIACDGLWKAFTVEAAAKFAVSVIEVHPATLLDSIALRIANVMDEKWGPIHVRLSFESPYCFSYARPSVLYCLSPSTILMIISFPFSFLSFRMKAYNCLKVGGTKGNIFRGYVHTVTSTFSHFCWATDQNLNTSCSG
jgi:hypothetical protein